MDPIFYLAAKKTFLPVFKFIRNRLGEIFDLHVCGVWRGVF